MDTLLDEMLLECQYVPLSYFLKLMLFFPDTVIPKFSFHFCVLLNAGFCFSHYIPKLLLTNKEMFLRSPRKDSERYVRTQHLQYEIISKISDL